MFRAQGSHDQSDDDQTKHSCYYETVSKKIIHGVCLKIDSLHPVIFLRSSSIWSKSAPRLPKCLVFPREANLLIWREMSSAGVARLVKLPRWQCRICGSVPVLRHQLCWVAHHMEVNP